MTDAITIPALQQMKREGRKIAGIVAWDYQMAGSRIVPASTSSRSAIRSASTCGAIPIPSK